MSDSTQIAVISAETLPRAYATEGGIDEIIKRIEAEVKAEAHDVTTAKGRKAIASLAYKVSQSKTALDEAGKKLNEDARKQIDAVDAERRKLRARLDTLRDEVRKPLDDWEAAEDARIDRAKAALQEVKTTGLTGEDTSEQIKAQADRVKAVVVAEEFGEYISQITTARENTLVILRAAYSAAKRAEDQEIELAKLRAEAEERAEADRLRIEAERAEQARLDAERAEAERLAQIERDKQEAAEKAAREAEERARIEAERAKHEADERAEAERRAAAEREAELHRQIEQERARAEAAAQAERDRIFAQQQAEADARAKREADQAHREKITADIEAALSEMAGKATPRLIAEALIDGRIPHVTVSM